MTAVDVVLVLWPDHASDLERLSAFGVPRLLLVAPEAPPPEDGDCLQDWVRLPADDRTCGRGSWRSSGARRGTAPAPP
jgi:hypothetical protein